MKASRRSRAAGFTIIELLLVLGVMALLMTVGFALWQEVNLRRAIVEETKRLNGARALLETHLTRYGSNYFLGRPGVPGSPNGGMGTPEFWGFNATMCPSGWCNEFGGDSYTGFADCSPPGPGPRKRGQGLRFGVGDVPGRACVQMVMNMAGGPGGPAWVEAVGVNAAGQFWTRSARRCSSGAADCVQHGTNMPSGLCPTGPANAVVMSPTDAVELCGDADTVDLRFVYLPGVPGVVR